MAFEINSKGEITIPAGDSASMTFSTSGSGITLAAGNTIHFVVYDKYSGETVIEKDATIVSASANISLSPTDTSVTPDDYTWNMRIKQGSTVVLSMFSVSPRFTVTEVE